MVCKMKQILKSYGLFLIGLFIASFGVALSTKAGLGTSPVSAVPYSISLVYSGLTFGWWLNMWSVAQIAVQVALLRSRCKPADIALQIVLAFAYGYMTDFSCGLINGVQLDGYTAQFSTMIASCFVIGFGIWIQFKGGAAMLPGEAMNRAISWRLDCKYENVKIFFDVLYIAVAALICFVSFGSLEGVREGSVIAAFIVGMIIKLYNYVFQVFCVGSGAQEEPE